MSALRMKLVFRLGEVGFSIPIEETIEILEVLPGWLNREHADPHHFLLGEMMHRGATIPVRDLRRRMQLRVGLSGKDAAVLVLGVNGDNFGLTADSIDGIFPEGEFVGFPVPFQFVDGTVPAFERIDVWRDAPLVALNAQALAAGWDV